MRLLFYGDLPRLIASLTYIDTNCTDSHIYIQRHIHTYKFAYKNTYTHIYKAQTHIQLLLKHCNEDSGDVSARAKFEF